MTTEIEITDEMIAAFDMAYLETLYPDRHDFVASHGIQRDAIVKGLQAAELMHEAIGEIERLSKPNKQPQTMFKQCHDPKCKKRVPFKLWDPKGSQRHLEIWICDSIHENGH